MSTARAGTETEAANEALGHIGQPPIADIGDLKLAARAVRLHFGTVRDELLRRKWWSFATRRSIPAADVTAGIGALTIRYPLPDDCLRVRYVEDSGGVKYDEDSGAWDIEGGTLSTAGVAVDAIALVTNIAAPRVVYTGRVTSVRLWWPDFLSAFTYELASRVATKLGRSQSKSAALHERAEKKLDEASGIDSKEQSRKSTPRSSSWLDGRRGIRSI